MASLWPPSATGHLWAPPSFTPSSPAAPSPDPYSCPPCLCISSPCTSSLRSCLPPPWGRRRAVASLHPSPELTIVVAVRKECLGFVATSEMGDRHRRGPPRRAERRPAAATLDGRRSEQSGGGHLGESGHYCLPPPRASSGSRYARLSHCSGDWRLSSAADC